MHAIYMHSSNGSDIPSAHMLFASLVGLAVHMSKLVYKIVESTS